MRYPIVQHIARYLCDTPEEKQAQMSFAMLLLKASRDMKSIAVRPLRRRLPRGLMGKLSLLEKCWGRAKLRRLILMTLAEVRAKNWAKFSAHFRASFAAQNDSQIFSQNSSQFITPNFISVSFWCLGGRNVYKYFPSSLRPSSF